jgi:hypothetical protein
MPTGLLVTTEAMGCRNAEEDSGALAMRGGMGWNTEFSQGSTSDSSHSCISIVIGGHSGERSKKKQSREEETEGKQEKGRAPDGFAICFKGEAQPRRRSKENPVTNWGTRIQT